MSKRRIKFKWFCHKINSKLPSRLSDLSSALIIIAFILSYPVNAMAYVGPGAGITMLGALWAVVLGIVIAVGGFLVWPIRTFLRRRKGAEIPSVQENAGESDEPDAE